MQLLYDTVIELDIYHKIMETYLHKNLYNNFIYNSQKSEMTQMCFTEKLNQLCSTLKYMIQRHNE